MFYHVKDNGDFASLERTPNWYVLFTRDAETGARTFFDDYNEAEEAFEDWKAGAPAEAEKANNL